VGDLNSLPAALIRGGAWVSGTGAGVFAVTALEDASNSGTALGFRCGR